MSISAYIYAEWRYRENGLENFNFRSIRIRVEQTYLSTTHAPFMTASNEEVWIRSSSLKLVRLNARTYTGHCDADGYTSF